MSIILDTHNSVSLNDGILRGLYSIQPPLPKGDHFSVPHGVEINPGTDMPIYNARRVLEGYSSFTASLDASNGDLQQQVADLAYILDHAPGVTPAIADQVMNELNTVYTTGKLNHNGYDELYIKLTNGNSLELTSFPPDPGSQYVSDYPEVGDWQFRVDIYMP